MKRLKTKEIINSVHDNLLIDEDESGLDDNWFPVAVITYSPDLKSFQHYHIELSLEQCKSLRNWLDTFLNKHKDISNG